MPVKQFIQTQRVSIIMTKRCTLKCKLCGALAPYVENYHPPVEFLKKEIDAFFKIVDKTGIIDISGGEPLLRTTVSDFALGEILLYLIENYGDRFDYLRIFTNGTIVPGERICKVFREVRKKKSFTITVDNYGKYSSKVKSIASRLEMEQIDYIIRDYSENVHCGGWVDLRDISLKHIEIADAKNLFAKCAIPQKLGCCFELMDGIISPCSVAAGRYLCGEAGKEDAEIIDLFAKHTEMKRKLLEIFEADYFPSCHYCVGGLSDDSERVVPAEQATDEEIREWREKYTMRV